MITTLSRQKARYGAPGDVLVDDRPASEHGPKEWLAMGGVLVHYAPARGMPLRAGGARGTGGAEMKYLVLRAKTGGLTHEIPFIFPNNLVHRLVAGAVKSTLRAHRYTAIECVSAGDYAPSLDGACSGKSTTLSVESRGVEDERLIAMCDYGAGIS